MFIDLQKVKDFLRVDFDDEDNLIQEMVDSASAYTFQYLNWDEPEREKEFPAPVISAILLMIGDLYVNREAQSDIQLYNNLTYIRLLGPYRKLII